MSHPDRQNTMALLTDWHHHHEAVEKMMDGIKASIGLDPNGPLFYTVWNMFDAYTGALAVEVGDFGGWLDWYYIENDMGKKAMTAGYNENTNPVKTLCDLCELILEARKREKP